MRQHIISVFAECLGADPVGLLEKLVEIGNGGKAHVIADRKDRVVCILQLERGLLQADMIQVFCHGVAGILAEAPAQVGFIEMEGF